MEADLAEYYHLNIRDIKQEGVIHVATLLGNLPPGARTLGKIKKEAGWTRTDILILALVNSLRDEKDQYNPFENNQKGLPVEEYERILSLPREEVVADG